MIAKKIDFGADARAKLKSGIKIISDAVCSTLGPGGSTVLIEDPSIVGGFKISKDGVSVAKSINVMDSVENLAIQMVKSAAERSATASGDGTTTTVCLVNAILRASEEYEGLEYNMSEIIRYMNEYALELDSALKRASLKLTKKRLLNIATISANNDPKLGKLVADVYSKVKHVTIEDSSSSEIHTRVTSGIKIERGWVSNVMVNNHKTQECVLEDSYILVTDSEIKDINVLVPMLQHIMSVNKSILIIGTFAPEALFTLNKNIRENGLKCCNIIPPGFGYLKDDLMSDLGIALNATFYNEKTGDNLEGITIDDLGLAKKIVVSKDYTVVVRDMEGIEDKVPAHISDLKDLLKNSTSFVDRKNVSERIACISGGVGVIFVGANSDIEQKEIYDRVEDAVFAVKSALEEGILPGGGVALINASREITHLPDNINQAAALDILTEALFVPFSQIIINTGVDPSKMEIKVDNSPLNGFGYNSKTKEFGMMDEMGIIDATKVTRNALKNSISVAGTIMSTAAVVSNIRE